MTIAPPADERSCPVPAFVAPPGYTSGTHHVTRRILTAPSELADRYLPSRSRSATWVHVP
jgi:hypothetical protein